MNPYVKAVLYNLTQKGVLKEEKTLGNNLMYICPFHHGEHQNFGVNMDTGQWNCFKCHKSGPDATALLKRLGVSSDGLNPADFYSIVDLKTEIEKAFASRLPKGELEEGDNFAIMPPIYPLETSDRAVRYVTGRGQDVSILAKAGVMYCPFGEYGDRLIFPWVPIDENTNGFVRGFSARAITEGGKKMLRPANASQKTMLYNPTFKPLKGARLVVVEGEFSAMALVHMGFHAVGIFGSYLHPGQIRLLLQAAEVVLLFDGDSVGDIGATHAYEKLHGWVPLLYRADRLPEGEDPASLYKQGPEGRAILRSAIFLEKQEGAISFLDVMRKKLRRDLLK